MDLALELPADGPSISRLIGGRFRVGPLIGQGGMSRVHRALDERTGTTVALKLMRDRAAATLDAARFAREAELLARLEHPAIVRHLAHGPGYLAMEWLAGEDLARRLTRGPLAIADAVALLRRCAEALAAAHASGIIHRDLKPSNLFLVDGAIDGLHLLDFGIARPLVATPLTHTGTMVGTPRYMSPEQVRAESRITPASDIHALGCIVYECLCGRPPFAAEHVTALFVQILLEAPAPVLATRPDVPRDLAALLARMLAKDPAARPQDAVALLAELGPAHLTVDPDAGEAPTLAAAPGGPRVAPRDPQLCCIVHAMPGDESPVASPRVTLREALRGLGARCEWRIDGSLIAVITSNASAMDQALVAAHAALLIRSSWPGARVALATGHAEVAARRPFGEAVERSTRLLASPDAADVSGIWVDPLSARLLERRFNLQPHRDVFLLAGERAVDDAARPLLRRPTPCVGRESELGILEVVLHDCIDESEARAVVVTGPPGAGKSRLRHEFLRRLAPRGCTVIAGAAEIMQAGTAHAALARGLRRLCGLVPGERPAAARARFAARIGAHLPAASAPRVIEFLAEMCELATCEPISPALRAAREAPAIRHGQIQRAFLEWLTAECGAAPVVLVLDDLQWGDRLTVALIDQALRSLAGAPLLVLALARPELGAEFPRLWAEHQPQEIGLRPLGRRACERLVQHMLGPELAPDVVARLAEHSAGNALYLEEIIRAFAESADPAPPQTVLAMLQARLGRLPPAPRRVLRVASVFGAAFRPAWLHALLADEMSVTAVDADLALLVDAELLERSATPDASAHELVFRHELTRRAAYTLLSDDERRDLHRAVGLLLVDSPAPAPRVVAEHLMLGGEPRRAGTWLLRSARQALANNDITGAQQLAGRAEDVDAGAAERGELAALRAMLAYWQRDYAACRRHGEAALEHLPRGAAAYYRVLGDAIVASARLGELDAVQRLLAAAEAEHHDEPALRERIVCLARAALQWMIAATLGPADHLLARLTDLCGATPLADPVLRAQVAHALGMRAAMRGDLGDYVAHLERVVVAFEEAGDLRNLAVERTTLAGCYFQLGLSERAESLARSNLAACEKLRAPQAIGFARMTLGGIVAHRPDARDEARRLLAAAETDYPASAHPRRRGMLHIYRAVLARAADEPAAAAVALLVDAPSFRAWPLALQALALVEQGRPADGLAPAHEAVAIHARLGALPTAEHLPRLALAEALLGLGDRSGARDQVVAACALLMHRADRIADREHRRHYLAIPAHRRLNALAATL